MQQQPPSSIKNSNNSKMNQSAYKGSSVSKFMRVSLRPEKYQCNIVVVSVV